ncbi:MAG TPA: hypothetical protein VG891_02745 [Rhizomicrobium sp.]|nr:hypothetical protein [Rhizomicrobium sp.]
MTHLCRIRLELARTEGFPEGSSQHGYVFVAPLDDKGHIDAPAWRPLKDRCFVTRFWGDEPVQHGTLRHVGGGWRFDYERNTHGDDEPFFKLEKHVMEPGAYVSLTEQDGVQRPFRVISVERLRKPEAA